MRQLISKVVVSKNKNFLPLKRIYSHFYKLQLDEQITNPIAVTNLSRQTVIQPAEQLMVQFILFYCFIYDYLLMKNVIFYTILRDNQNGFKLN